MKNEKKARELAKKHMPFCGVPITECIDTALEMAEWKDSEYSWQEIPKDKHGFYDDLKKNLYNELPIIVCCNQDSMYPILEYIDKDNWGDAVSDLSKPNYHYYMKVQPLKESKL